MVFIIAALNAVVFLLMAASSGEIDWTASHLAAWGGNLGELSLHGQWWRLLTATFLHASLTHIFGNMVLLLVVGTYVEAKIGSVAFTVVYGACGVAASVLSALGHPDGVSVGASGAIAGLVGIMAAFYWSGRCPEISGRWLAQVVGINAAYSFAPNVDLLAHGGGFVAGLAAGAGLLALGFVPYQPATHVEPP